MSQHSNIAKSGRGQVAHELWNELMRLPESGDPQIAVESAVQFVAVGMMSFSDLAGYIDFHDLQFHDVPGPSDPLGDTPTNVLERVVAADLTQYLLEGVLAAHLAIRAERFAWSDEDARWTPKDYPAAP